MKRYCASDILCRDVIRDVRQTFSLYAFLCFFVIFKIVFRASAVYGEIKL